MAGLRLDLRKVDKDLQAELEKEDSPEEVEEMDPLTSEEQLSSLERIEKFCQSDSIMERDIAIRSVIEAAYTISLYSEFETILDIVCPMGSDHEPLIRVGVLGTITILVERNSEFREKGDVPFGQENEDRLYEIPVKMLNDYNQQVRRVSHNCIISLLDEPRGPIDSLLRQLCPMIERCLGREENYDLRMDTALLISRVSPLIDPELCRVHFVPLLSSLALDSMFHVRKAFAMCCRDLCPSVGEECTERDILPLFLQLCKDEVWGVRKACADVFMDMSASCSLVSRHDKLTPVFLNLLRDDSRWVRKAAFQSLGPFISTFYTQIGSSSSEKSTSFEPIGDSDLLDNSLLNSSDTSLESRDQPVAIVTNHNNEPCSSPDKVLTLSSPPNCVSVSVFNSSKGISVGSQKEAPQDEFGLFQFWRLPIPSLLPETSPDSCSIKNRDQSFVTSETSPDSCPVKNRDQSSVIDKVLPAGRRPGDVVTGDIGDMGIPDDDMSGDNSVFREGEGEDCDDYRGDLTDIKDELLAESAGMATTENKGSKAYSEGVVYSDVSVSINSSYPQVRILIQSSAGQIVEDELMSGCGLSTINKSVAMEMTSVDNISSSETFTVTENKQNIVPEELIDMYMSMTDPLRTQSIDAELPFYCAFSFPAVLQTLGSENWALLKPTFEALASDMQWKIRRVLAFSLHEIAIILGQEKTVADLLGVIDEYCTKDLDDVKYGVLNHLADFFEIVPNDVRKEYFPYVLNGLLDTENERNWRYRNLLAEQLILVCNQCDCQFVSEHIAPVAIKLAYDRVANVRDTATKLFGAVLQKFDHSNPKLCSQLLTELRNNFSNNSRWLLRLQYVKQCHMIYRLKLVNLSVFAVECIPVILTLSKDVVPNVRMAVGRLLNEAITQTEYFSLNSHFSQDIEQVLETLQSDSDRDVRFFSGVPLPDPTTPRAEQNYADDVFFTHRLSEDDAKIDITRAADLLRSS